MLTTGLLGLVALSRAGSQLFWRAEGISTALPAPASAIAPVAALVLLNPMLLIASSPVIGYVEATANQLLAPTCYVAGVLLGDSRCGQP
jgi:multicomponent K+:H+ antiporter subunit D